VPGLSCFVQCYSSIDFLFMCSPWLIFVGSFVSDRPSSGRKEERGGRGVRSEFEERVVQIRRVTKVVKGGKQLSFRAVVVVGDKKGKVGVGVNKAKEVITAVQKASLNAKRNLVTVPMTKYKTFPHRSELCLLPF
jgi:ribosomal protein S5